MVRELELIESLDSVLGPSAAQPRVPPARAVCARRLAAAAHRSADPRKQQRPHQRPLCSRSRKLSVRRLPPAGARDDGRRGGDTTDAADPRRGEQGTILDNDLCAGARSAQGHAACASGGNNLIRSDAAAGGRTINGGNYSAM